LKGDQHLGRTALLHFQCQRISQATNQHEADSKQSNGLAEILNYMESRWEMQASKLIPIVSPVGQNKLPFPIVSPTQLNDPIGDKNRITSMVFKKAGCADLGKDKEDMVRAW
jgi:hypothetical protein